MSSGIYLIENLQNNKKYIGSSKNIEQRFRAHKSLLNRNKHSNNHLQNAWNKYSNNSFSFSIYKETVNLLEEETSAIASFNSISNGYNILTAFRKKGTFHHSDETKQKLREAAIKRDFGHTEMSESGKEALSKLRAGKTFEEFFGVEKANRIKEKIRIKNLSREYRKGFTVSESTKNKMSKSHKGKRHTEETKEKCKIAKIGEKNHQFIKISKDIKETIKDLYNEDISLRKISKTIGISRHLIKKVIMEENLWV